MFSFEKRQERGWQNYLVVRIPGDKVHNPKWGNVLSLSLSHFILIKNFSYQCFVKGKTKIILLKLSCCEDPQRRRSIWFIIQNEEMSDPDFYLVFILIKTCLTNVLLREKKTRMRPPKLSCCEDPRTRSIRSIISLKASQCCRKMFSPKFPCFGAFPLKD